MFLLSANFEAEASEREPTANTSASGRERKPFTNCLAMAPVPSIPHRNFLTTCSRPSLLCLTRPDPQAAMLHTLRRGFKPRKFAPALWWYVERSYHYLEGVNRGV